MLLATITVSGCWVTVYGVSPILPQQWDSMSRAFCHAQDRCHRHLHGCVARGWVGVVPMLGYPVFAGLCCTPVSLNEISMLHVTVNKSQIMTQKLLTESSDIARIPVLM